VVAPGEKKILQGNGLEGILEYKMLSAENRIYMRGEITYHDDRGAYRTTSFIRRFDNVKNGFVRIDEFDPLAEYDYED